jgi:hypothetical protein
VQKEPFFDLYFFDRPFETRYQQPDIAFFPTGFLPLKAAALNWFESN